MSDKGKGCKAKKEPKNDPMRKFTDLTAQVKVTDSNIAEGVWRLVAGHYLKV